MLGVSRSCFLRHQCVFKPPQNLHVFLPSGQKPRLFSSAIILRAGKKPPRPNIPLKQPLLKNKPSQTPTKSSAVTPTPVYLSFASTLAQKAHPTVLYEAPSHTRFIISSYGAAIFCFTYAGFSFYANYINAPPDLAPWVPIAFGGICFMMGAFGGWLILGPSRLIRTITAVPQKSAAAVGALGTGLARAANPQLKIEVELRKMFPLPFLPPRRLSVRPEEVVLRGHIGAVDRQLTGTEIRFMRAEEERQKKALQEFDRQHVMTIPIRHASRAFFQLFIAIRRVWTREGFMKMVIRGQTYKLDVSGGWALDSGRALERLVTVKPRL